MPRFLPVVAALLIGCGGANANLLPPPPSAPPEAPAVEQPVAVAHDAWSITLPPRWKVDDAKQVQGDLTQVLQARSPYDVGRGPIILSLSTMAFDGQDIAFAMMAAALAEQFVSGGKLMKQQLIVLDGRPTSMSVIVTRRGIGMGIFALASSGTGYILTCGGDALAGGSRVVDTCTEVVTSFRLK
jgi:hypothetical protein